MPSTENSWPSVVKLLALLYPKHGQCGNWLCLCVRFNFPYSNKLAKKTYRFASAPQKIQLNVFFRKTASSQSYSLLVFSCLPFCLSLLPHEHILITWDVALDYVVFLPALPLCCVSKYSAHAYSVSSNLTFSLNNWNVLGYILGRGSSTFSA